MLKRGEVWFADFGERRPVVLLSKTADAQFRCIQIVEPVDIDIAGLGLEVPQAPITPRHQPRSASMAAFLTAAGLPPWYDARGRCLPQG